MSASITLLAYNMHLFGDLGDVADVKAWYQRVKGDDDIVLYTWHEKTRKDALISWLSQLPNAPDIISLEEVWWKDYVEHIKSDLKKTYPNAYDHADAKFTNTAGVLLLANNRFSVQSEYHFGYRSNLTSVPDDNGNDVTATWDSQDTVPTTDKGYRGLLLQFQLDGVNAQLGVFNTHMPTGGHTHKPAVRACFVALASAVCAFQKQYPSAPVIVLGDFNLHELTPGSSSDPDAPEDLYSEWIASSTGTATFQGAHLLDVYRAVASDPSTCPGYTAGPPNTFWTHFNPKKPQDSTSDMRIDYFFVADAADGTIGFDRDSLRMQVLNGQPQTCTAESSSGNTRPTFTDPDDGHLQDLSDHYPIWGQVSLSRKAGS